jgi:hypothetical protein
MTDEEIHALLQRVARRVIEQNTAATQPDDRELMAQDLALAILFHDYMQRTY